MIQLLASVVGLCLIGSVLLDAFEAVVLPRRVTRRYRFTRAYYRTSWRAWRWLADHIPAGGQRQSILSIYGPLSLLGLFWFWAVGLLIGFGLLQFAVAPDGRGLGETLYLSGTTFTTLGYGDVTPAGAAGRVLAVAEALLGLGFLAVVVGYLPVFYQAFSRRELTISLLDARAGSPPSGAALLLRLPPKRGRATNRFLEETERWAAELLESHLSYPVLSFYRSQHDNQSWLAALTCSLDAAALTLTVAAGADRQQARLTFAVARHAIVDIALVLRLQPVPAAYDRLPPARLTELLAALRSAGWTVRDDEPAAAKLGELRGLYEPFAQSLADFLRLDLHPVWADPGRPDNWQTSAGMRRAAGLGHLAADPRDEHFE
ncbi:MAG TPA: potassium channel family protein [Gemmataceae bacterium]|nr:potassium channel family protein [Gemmataceae bacterium]